MDVEWFSSVVMGVVDFKKLWTYGHAHISDNSQVSTIDRLFHSRDKPVTMEEF